MQIHFIDNGLGLESSSHLLANFTRVKKNSERALMATFFEHYSLTFARAKQNEWIFHEQMSDS